MKTLVFFIFSMFFVLQSCNNDDDNNFQNPIDQLPPETQAGENTFGCLLDGEPFLPSGGINPLDCQYQFVDSEYYFRLQGNKQDENFNLLGLFLHTNALEIIECETYQLLLEADENATGIFGFNGDLFFTNSNQTGQMTITHLDLTNQTVSGTFFFDVIDQNGELRQIREGRFDMQFTL
jgi:hypothetical protein